MSCLFLSSQQRLILPFQVPELTPTTPNKNSQMTAVIEALSFLGPRGHVARDMDSCICYDSKHVAGVCQGTVQAHTHIFILRLHVSGRRCAPNAGYGLPCTHHSLLSGRAGQIACSWCMRDTLMWQFSWPSIWKVCRRPFASATLPPSP